MSCPISCDTMSDSGFMEEDNEYRSVSKQSCTVDDIACFMRNLHIDNRDLYDEMCFQRSSLDGSVDSIASTVQSEDRKSVLKSALSYKRMQWKVPSTTAICTITDKRQSKHEDTKKAKLRKSVKTTDSNNIERRCKSSPVKRNVSINTQDDEKHSSKESYKTKMQSKQTCAQYDSRLERSKTFLHGQSKIFSKASQFLTPAKPGLQKLQVCYSKTNTELNSGKIFGDLVRTAHKQNLVICDTVNSIERRLFKKRTDPAKKTSYFKNMNKPDPFRVSSVPKKAQTVAEKKKERKERIAETTEEIKIGYKPTAKTVKLLSPEEVEKLKRCRYLRLDPVLQLKLEEYEQ